MSREEIAVWPFKGSGGSLGLAAFNLNREELVHPENVASYVKEHLDLPWACFDAADLCSRLRDRLPTGLREELRGKVRCGKVIDVRLLRQHILYRARHFSDPASIEQLAAGYGRVDLDEPLQVARVIWDEWQFSRTLLRDVGEDDVPGIVVRDIQLSIALHWQAGPPLLLDMQSAAAVYEECQQELLTLSTTIAADHEFRKAFQWDKERIKTSGSRVMIHEAKLRSWLRDFMDHFQDVNGDPWCEPKTLTSDYSLEPGDWSIFAPHSRHLRAWGNAAELMSLMYSLEQARESSTFEIRQTHRLFPRLKSQPSLPSGLVRPHEGNEFVICSFANLNLRCLHCIVGKLCAKPRKSTDSFANRTESYEQALEQLVTGREWADTGKVVRLDRKDIDIVVHCLLHGVATDQIYQYLLERHPIRSFTRADVYATATDVRKKIWPELDVFLGDPIRTFMESKLLNAPALLAQLKCASIEQGLGALRSIQRKPASTAGEEKQAIGKCFECGDHLFEEPFPLIQTCPLLSEFRFRPCGTGTQGRVESLLDFSDSIRKSILLGLAEKGVAIAAFADDLLVIEAKEGDASDIQTHVIDVARHALIRIGTLAGDVFSCYRTDRW